MTLTVDQISKIVQLCWGTAANCPLEGVPTGMFQGNNNDLNAVRWTTYCKLLDNLLPKNNVVDSTITVPKEKEPWQE